MWVNDGLNIFYPTPPSLFAPPPPIIYEHSLSKVSSEFVMFANNAYWWSDSYMLRTVHNLVSWGGGDFSFLRVEWH